MGALGPVHFRIAETKPKLFSNFRGEVPGIATWIAFEHIELSAAFLAQDINGQQGNRREGSANLFGQRQDIRFFHKLPVLLTALRGNDGPLDLLIRSIKRTAR